MKIPFSKINKIPYPFELELDNAKFKGSLVKIEPKLAKMNGTLNATFYRVCDRCAEELEINMQESLELYLSDGIFKDKDNKLSDTIEFFDGCVDLLEIALCEIEAYLSGYFYCKMCA